MTGTVSMTIKNKTWGEIFQALLAQQGLSATVMAGDIIRVDSPGELSKLDSIEVLTQAVVRLNYAKAVGDGEQHQGDDDQESRVGHRRIPRPTR